MFTSAALLLTLSVLADDPVAIEVSSHLGEIDTQVEEQTLAGAVRGASAVGHDIQDGARLVVRIDVGWRGDSTSDFEVSISAGPRGEVEQVYAFPCASCSPTELVNAVEARTGPIIESLVAQHQAAAVEEPPPPLVTPPPADSPISDRPQRLGPLGKGGIASLSVGAALLITGIAFVAVNKKRASIERGEVFDRTQFRNYRKPGYGLLAGAGAALIVGTVLLVVDRKRAKSSRVAILPAPGGLSLAGAF